MSGIKTDSKEGALALINWARAHGFVLNQAQIKIAQKHGVDVSGVMVAAQLPASSGPAFTLGRFRR